MGTNLFNKIWDLHRIKTLPDGMDQIFIGLHLLHEVTSPQAFRMLEQKELAVKYPERTFATVDHIIPTDSRSRPLEDPLAEEMLRVLEDNTRRHGIPFFGLDSEDQGIIHIIGPELGLTQPGMTISCGDSHTSTHGAFGAIAFGIGTSQVRDILATQTLALNRSRVRKIEVKGKLLKGVTAKDLALKLIQQLGVKGGVGYAYEYCGEAVSNLSMEERMTLCNMTIEGGARVGYVNPDETTFAYLKGKRFAPSGRAFERAEVFWKSIASDPDAAYDDHFVIQAGEIEPMVTWGINPGQAIGIDQRIPFPEDLSDDEAEVAEKAFRHMGFREGDPVRGRRIDVAFIGSCTNGRISDLREAARVARGMKKADHVRALVVPGSMAVDRQAKEEGLDLIFKEAGFEYRQAGCSMCLAMNPDKLEGNQISASSSNRNFIGRQGSPEGRTLLMSPAMVAAAAITGYVTDSRELWGEADGR